MSTRSSRGFVSLVGAGPGDLALLTRKAAMRLAEAELVLYDALVDPAALDLAPSAQRVYVGKRAGRPQVRQEFINWLMVRAARRGRRVVRLKGGDPFVFGRGGEEALALATAGVPFEIVPGVSSAIAAAALAGIPVTHRGISTGFVVVSGHAEEAYRPVLESLAPASATVVVMMGLGRIDKIAELLIDRGWNALTPAAIVFGASTSASDVWTMTLRELQQGIDATESGNAGTVVVGEVVRLRAALASYAVRLKPDTTDMEPDTTDMEDVASGFSRTRQRHGT
jgi:uroporphyrin-III C-methyltransferase / precorrin-2 dehydrogenase / sirohydrochlorin ferrochelatase